MSWDEGIHMRVGRLLADEKANDGFYHCITRVVDRRFALKAKEKGKFVKLMRAYEEFCGVQVLTFCVLANHLHIICDVPRRPEELPCDEELVRLVKRADLDYGAKNLEDRLRQMRSNGDDLGAERLREQFFRRMWSLSGFMQSIKQRFSQWFNRRHGRTGTLWEGRFKSVLVEGGSEVLAVMSAYVDLNAVRAKIVKDPREYRWCGYGEAVAGNKLARAGLSKVVLGYLENAKPGESDRARDRRVLETYRVFLYKNGISREASADGTPAREGFSAKEVEAVIKAGGKLSYYETLRCRVRYFSDGCVIGSRSFVESCFEANRQRFGKCRKSGAREMRGVDFPQIFTARDLRREVVSTPLAK